jgi:hypothetical protein
MECCLLRAEMRGKASYDKKGTNTVGGTRRAELGDSEPVDTNMMLSSQERNLGDISSKSLARIVPIPTSVAAAIESTPLLSQVWDGNFS